jgi:hypothetical protein
VISINLLQNIPDFRGMCLENLIITTKYFPIRIPFLYKIGLKKLTLHEVPIFLEGEIHFLQNLV